MEIEQMLKTLEMPVKNLGVNMVNDIINVLKSKDKIASGRLINSIKHEYQIDIDNIKLLITSEDYLTYVDQGRKPGKYAPIQAIKDWVKLKGIDEKYAFAINHNIFKFGIKPLNFMEGLTAEYSKPDKFGGVIKQYNKIVSDYLKWEFEQIQKNMK